MNELRNNRIILHLIVLMFFTLTLNIVTISMVYAEEDLGSLNQAIKANRGITDRLDQKGKDTLIGLSKDLFDVTRYVVIAGIVIRGLLIFLDFSKADDPYIRTRIRTQAIWLSLGVIFSVNFWTIFNFVRSTLSKVKLL